MNCNNKHYISNPVWDDSTCSGSSYWWSESDLRRLFLFMNELRISQKSVLPRALLQRLSRSYLDYYRYMPRQGLHFHRLLCLRYGYCCFVYSEMECCIAHQGWCLYEQSQRHKASITLGMNIIEQISNELAPPICEKVQWCTAASDLRKLGKMFFLCCFSRLGKLATASATFRESKTYRLTVALILSQLITSVPKSGVCHWRKVCALRSPFPIFLWSGRRFCFGPCVDY